LVLGLLGLLGQLGLGRLLLLWLLLWLLLLLLFCQVLLLLTGSFSWCCICSRG
jgi:hypothetical protein